MSTDSHKKLIDFLKTVKEGVSRDEFLTGFKMLVDTLKESNENNEDKLNRLLNKFEETISELLNRNDIEYVITDLELSLKDLVNSSERSSLLRTKELSQRFSSEIQRLESSIPEAQDISSLEIKIRNIEDSITTPDNAVQIADKINTLHEYIKPEVIIGWDEINKKINKGSLPKDFDVRIGVSKTELRRVEDRVTVLEGSSGGGGVGAWFTPAESVSPDGSVTVFTTTTAPTDVVSDGIMLFDGFGYTYSAGQITLDNGPTQFIKFR